MKGYTGKYGVPVCSNRVTAIASFALSPGIGSTWLSLLLTWTSELSATSHTEWVQTPQKCWGSIHFQKELRSIFRSKLKKHLKMTLLAKYQLPSSYLYGKHIVKKMLHQQYCSARDLALPPPPPPPLVIRVTIAILLTFKLANCLVYSHNFLN